MFFKKGSIHNWQWVGEDNPTDSHTAYYSAFFPAFDILIACMLHSSIATASKELRNARSNPAPGLPTYETMLLTTTTKQGIALYPEWLNTPKIFRNENKQGQESKRRIVSHVFLVNSVLFCNTRTRRSVVLLPVLYIRCSFPCSFNDIKKGNLLSRAWFSVSTTFVYRKVSLFSARNSFNRSISCSFSSNIASLLIPTTATFPAYSSAIFDSSGAASAHGTHLIDRNNRKRTRC